MLKNLDQIKSSADMLHSETEVEAAIDHMAEQINHCLSDKNPVLLCLLNGGIAVSGQLLTRLNFPLTLDAINASRYNNNTTGGKIKWILKPNTELKNRTVLIVDDILDEGITLKAIYDYCQEQGAQSIYTAVLVEKRLNRPKPISADFIGLTVANRYLFGYGMDYQGYLRNEAGIFACQEEHT